MNQNKKKGETKHHICYKPEIVVNLPSKGAHLILTSFQSMRPTQTNIDYIDNYIKALTLIKWEKQYKLNQQNEKKYQNKLK